MVNELSKQNIYFIFFRTAAFLSVGVLLFILLYVFKEGVGVINLKFLALKISLIGCMAVCIFKPPVATS